ncbi:hypothetical protein NDU88_001805 [Pleurodeles waltl]|uniref:Uncharacterized protein n=1 Tax=Pleurodeles waltl TaxID=8319 RepID=A0AAV7NK77_PLEWA|nr:hypothetical protein NDU88_001805 [Pleurodeles waltl]
METVAVRESRDWLRERCMPYGGQPPQAARKLLLDEAKEEKWAGFLCDGGRQQPTLPWWQAAITVREKTQACRQPAEGTLEETMKASRKEPGYLPEACKREVAVNAWRRKTGTTPH